MSDQLMTALQHGFKRARFVGDRRQSRIGTNSHLWHSDTIQPFMTAEELRKNPPDRINCQYQAWLAKRVGYIYFLWIEGTQWVKIGKSTDPATRAQQIFTVELPFDIYLLHAIRTDDMHVLESALHRYYRDKRGRGEWFQLDNADLWRMKAITRVYFHKQNRLIVWPEQQYLPYPAVCDNLESA